MRRILLLASLSVAVVAVTTSAAVAKPKRKPLTYKVGTYNAKVGVGSTKFTITLKRATCPGAPGQAKSSSHLCVVLPVSPGVECNGPVPTESPIGSFVAPVQLPNSGTVAQQAPITTGSAVPGGPPTTGQSTFSVTFTKKGTATGYLEESLTLASSSNQTFPCTSGKVPFTAKLG
jgi:hypothetical protein